MRWNADGGFLASASDDRTVRVWRLPEASTHGRGLDQQEAQHAQHAQQAQQATSAGMAQHDKELLQHAQQAQHSGRSQDLAQHAQQAQHSGPSQDLAQHAQQAQHDPAACLQPEHVLYGHSARLWDCHFGDNILVTASEDCTARYPISLVLCSYHTCYTVVILLEVALAYTLLCVYIIQLYMMPGINCSQVCEQLVQHFDQGLCCLKC